MSETLESASPEPRCEAQLAAGARVGEYEIRRCLGSGGFGHVYEALQPTIGKRVAVKVLSHRYSADERSLSRFVTEARVAVELRHRNVVEIFSFGRLDDGRAYYVMELVEGTTLRALLDRRGVIAPATAIPILAGIAAGLDAVHVHGVVHRDLKPENVLLAEEEGVLVPKLIDFGVAKLLEVDDDAHNTRDGALIGTPEYMSPEQCRGRKVDPRSDVYSLGVVAYEMLTGRVPFTGRDPLEVMLRHTSRRPRPPGLWPNADAAILAALAKQPGQRPASAGDVVRALAQPPPRLGPRGARHWLMALGAGTAAIAVALLLGQRSDAAASRPPPQRSSATPSIVAPAAPLVSPPASASPVTRVEDAGARPMLPHHARAHRIGPDDPEDPFEHATR